MKNRLKVYREKLNLTQTEFAQELDIDRPAYNLLENNKKSIGLKVLTKIFLYLRRTYFPDIHMEDLLDFDE